jgi:thioredoxin reductase
MFLTKFATHIDLLVRKDKLRASDVLQKELAKNTKITVHYNTTTDEIVGEDKKVVKVVGTDTTTGQKVEYPTDGVFVLIGLNPNTQFLEGSGVELSPIKAVTTNTNLETNVPGIFCAGDVRDGATLQIASAVGEGAHAAMKIGEYLDSHNEQYPEKVAKTEPQPAVAN